MFLAWPQDTEMSGPLGLIIQYRCAPAKRAEFRRAMSSSQSVLNKLRSEGSIAEYHILFSRYVDTNSWDALLLLSFASYHDLLRWKDLEVSTPAGLSAEALELTISVESYPVDMVRSGRGSDRPSSPVYFIIPYSLTVSAAAYQKYADDYVIPQFNGWIREGILSGFQMFMQRYTAARPWDTMIFLRYKDDQNFGRREEIVAKVRRELASNAVWKATSDNKQSVRVEKEAIIADDLAADR
jgi:hypothetical protein